MTRRLLGVLVTSCVALSACGGGGNSGGGHPAGGSTHATVASDRALFSQACGACHTLTGHNDPRHQGGDLLAFHASRAEFLQLAGEMPMRRPLTRRQLEAVVAFVMSVEDRR